MAQYPLGKVAITNKGAWSSSTNYTVLDTVTRHGGSFMCIQNNSNKEPGVASGWQSYWIAMTLGIKAVAVQALSEDSVKIVITFSDATTYTSGEIQVTSIADGAVGTSQLASQAVDLTSKVKNVLPVANGGTGASNAASARTNLNAQEKHSIATVTIAVGDWNSSNECTKTVQGVTASNLVVAQADSATIEEAARCVVRMKSQAANSITFKARTKPEASITMNIAIFN